MKFRQNMPIQTVNFFIFLGLLAAPPAVFGADVFSGNLKGVSIKEATSTNQPPIPVINSRVVSESPYQVELDASGSSDADNAISKYVWTTGDGKTLTGPVVTYAFTTEASVPVTLAVTDEAGAVAIILKTITWPWNRMVNFQPANVAVPSGFVMDSGAAFDATKGYGWVTPPRLTNPTADRNNPLSKDKTYDTLVIYVPTSIWEVGVPNGLYTVSVCVGDPTYPIGNQYVQVENQSVIAGLPLSAQNPWIERSIDVMVNDGRLTLAFAGAYERGQINWVKIKIK